MNNDFFALLVLGHLTGDFLLQNKWMAMNKSGSTWKCCVHCFIYSACVYLFTFSSIASLSWFAFVFLSHFPIDRWSLADKWLDLIGGRSLGDFLENGEKGVPKEYNKFNYSVLRGGFSSVVYTVADNTMHLLIMYFGAKYLFL